jgi:hypothetical protein
MELEEMQKVWAEMSEQHEKQARLTDKLIIMMTQQQYRNRLSKIAIPETISTVVAFGIVLLILINFGKYDTGWLVACSIVSAAILLVLPVLSLRAIHKMNNLNIGGNSYKQTLIEFAKGKRQFLFVQKLSFFLGFVLAIACMPVMLKIMGGKEIHIKPGAWLWFLPAVVVFILFFRWVYGCYARTTSRMEDLLKEVED